MNAIGMACVWIRFNGDENRFILFRSMSNGPQEINNATIKINKCAKCNLREKFLKLKWFDYLYRLQAFILRRNEYFIEWKSPFTFIMKFAPAHQVNESLVDCANSLKFTGTWLGCDAKNFLFFINKALFFHASSPEPHCQTDFLIPIQFNTKQNKHTHTKMKWNERKRSIYNAQ